MFRSTIGYFLCCDAGHRDKYNGDQHHRVVLYQPVPHDRILHGCAAENYEWAYEVKNETYQELGMGKHKEPETELIIHRRVGFLFLPSQQRFDNNNDQENKNEIS